MNFVKDLTYGTRFVLPLRDGEQTPVYVATGVRTGGGTTVVTYRLESDLTAGEWQFHKPSLSTCTIL